MYCVTFVILLTLFYIKHRKWCILKWTVCKRNKICYPKGTNLQVHTSWTGMLCLSRCGFTKVYKKKKSRFFFFCISMRCLYVVCCLCCCIMIVFIYFKYFSLFKNHRKIIFFTSNNKYLFLVQLSHQDLLSTVNFISRNKTKYHIKRFFDTFWM